MLSNRQSQRQYPGRLKVFLDYLGLEGTLDEKARHFSKKARNNRKWLQDSLMKFIVYQKEALTRIFSLHLTARDSHHKDLVQQ